jgi:hypothetical protein
MDRLFFCVDLVWIAMILVWDFLRGLNDPEAYLLHVRKHF